MVVMSESLISLPMQCYHVFPAEALATFPFYSHPTALQGEVFHIQPSCSEEAILVSPLALPLVPLPEDPHWILFLCSRMTVLEGWSHGPCWQCRLERVPLFWDPAISGASEDGCPRLAEKRRAEFVLSHLIDLLCWRSRPASVIINIWLLNVLLGDIISVHNASYKFLNHWLFHFKIEENSWKSWDFWTQIAFVSV